MPIPFATPLRRLAPRQCGGKDGPVNTRFTSNICRGSGFVGERHPLAARLAHRNAIAIEPVEQ